MIRLDIVVPRKNFDLVIKEEFSSGITGIYGPSGAGKTSFFQALAGLIKPQSGSVMINYRHVFDSERKINKTVAERRTGYVFQEGRLFPHLSVEKNLLYGFKKKADNLISYRDVVKLLNLGKLLKSKPSQISGGERQRTALGRALLSSPEVLLLDEPFSALDVHLRNQIVPFLYKIHQQVRIPILIVSHDISDLLKLSERLFILKEGRCIGHGNYTDLLRVPALRQMIGANVLVNSLEMRVDTADDSRGLVTLSNKKMTQKLTAVYNRDRVRCLPDNNVKLFIRSDDITLSNDYVEGISVGNQIEGVLTEIINGSHINVCIVDVGVPLTVEITADSKKRMGLEVGKTVWCLFKSVAVDIVV